MPFELGQRVRKVKGSSWQGRIVGIYSTSLTPEGYAVEREREPGIVQIYPASALEDANQEGGGALEVADQSTEQHVVPPASASSGSGRAEVTGGDMINALIVASNDYECSVPKSSDELRSLRKKLVAAKQTLLDHIVHMHDVGFLSGRRSMQEQAARVADAWNEAESSSDSPGDDIRALNPETKP